MRKMRTAVIGCGRIAAVYQQAFSQMAEELEVVAAFDKDLSKAEKWTEAFPGCVASDRVGLDAFPEQLRELQVDVVHILLPHFLHASYTIAALKAGVHVLTEKPIAIAVEDADAMMDAAKASGRVLGVIYQNRYINGVQRVKELISSGELGAVKGAFSTLNWFRPASYYECDWKGKWATEGGGVVIDQAIHSIDLVRYMTGLEATRVQAHIARRVLTNIEVEDEADAAIVLSNGAIYSFFACNYYTTNSPIRVEIACENGTALLTQEHMTIQWKDGRAEEIAPEAVSKDGGKTAWGYWGGCHQKQIAAFYEALRTGQTPPWTAEDAKRTLALVQAIYCSAKTNSEILLQ